MNLLDNKKEELFMSVLTKDVKFEAVSTSDSDEKVENNVFMLLQYKFEEE